jgi:hypothetical protein
MSPRYRTFCITSGVLSHIRWWIGLDSLHLCFVLVFLTKFDTFFLLFVQQRLDTDRILFFDIPLRSFPAARWRRQALHQAIHRSNNDIEEVEMRWKFGPGWLPSRTLRGDLHPARAYERYPGIWLQ